VAPKNWNDVLSVVVLVLIVGVWLILSRTGLAVEQQGLIIGAGVVWIGQIISYYYRRTPSVESGESVQVTRTQQVRVGEVNEAPPKPEKTK
jgi:hypothetical protein